MFKKIMNHIDFFLKEIPRLKGYFKINNLHSNDELKQHELLERTWLFSDMFGKYVEENELIQSNEQFRIAAEKASDSLNELYTILGNKFIK